MLRLSFKLYFLFFIYLTTKINKNLKGGLGILFKLFKDEFKKLKVGCGKVENLNIKK